MDGAKVSGAKVEEEKRYSYQKNEKGVIMNLNRC